MLRSARLLAVASLILTLEVSSLARAERGAAAGEPDAQTLPLPPPGTQRLIHIGPQADVVEDDRGRLRMADEPPPKPRRGRSILSVLIVLAAAGAVLSAGRNELTSGIGGRAPGPP